MTLELSHEQARTLRYILDLIGGNPKASRRKHTEQMIRQLNKAGYSRLSVVDVGAELDKNKPWGEYIWFLNHMSIMREDGHD